MIIDKIMELGSTARFLLIVALDNILQKNRPLYVY